MADTGLLITPHGSALENVLFMRKGASVIEVRNQRQAFTAEIFVKKLNAVRR